MTILHGAGTTGDVAVWASGPPPLAPPHEQALQTEPYQHGFSEQTGAITMVIGAEVPGAVVLAADSRTPTSSGYRDTRSKVRAFPEAGFALAMANDDLLMGEVFDACDAAASPPGDATSWLFAQVLAGRDRLVHLPGGDWRTIDAIAGVLVSGRPTLVRLFGNDGWIPKQDNLCWTAPPGSQASFLLGRHFDPVMPVEQVIRLLVAVIAETARVNTLVGGPVQVVVLDGSGPRAVEDKVVAEALNSWNDPAHGIPAKIRQYLQQP